MEELKVGETAADAYYKMLKPENKDVKTCLQAAKTKDSEIPDSFKCIVFDPKECEKCNRLICADCLEDWKSSGKKSCPHCLQQCNTRPVGRIVQGFLDAVKFRGCPLSECSKKSTKFTYEKLAMHLKTECMVISVDCPMGCGTNFEKNVWQTHFEECKIMSLQCEKCEEKYERDIFLSHDCASILSKKLIELRQKNEELKNQHDRLLQSAAAGAQDGIPLQIVAQIEQIKQRPFRPILASHKLYDGKSFFYNKARELVFCGEHKTIMPARRGHPANEGYYSKCSNCNKSLQDLKCYHHRCDQCAAQNSKFYICLTCVKMEQLYQ